MVVVIGVAGVDTGRHRGAPMGLRALIASLSILLEQEVVSCRQMVMFVILNGPLDGLDAEPKRGLHLHYEFVIDRSSHSVIFIILILGLVEAIPGVLL